jgi:predicted aspartyl protease
MGQSSIGAIGSGASIRFPHAQAYAWAVLCLAVLLTGCVETAPVISKALVDSRTLFRSPLIQSAVSISYRVPLASGWLFSAPEVVRDLTSEPYWKAVADLDLSASRNAARSEAQIGFADAIALLSAGYLEKAESAFVALSRQTTDANVAVAAHLMLGRTLLYERKWLALRDLRLNSTPEMADRDDTAELEQWGRAFAGVERQIAEIPDKPVLLRLSLTRLGTPAVKVRINGREYEFWLDTGSSITVLSSHVAGDAKVPIVSDDTLMVRTFAGVAPVRPALIRRMELGPIVFTNSSAIVIDDALMRLKLAGEGMPQRGLRIDGIIGWDTIRQLDVAMDYGIGTLAVQRPENLGTTGTAAQNLSWVGKPLIEARAKTGKTFHFTLDTGAQGSFVNASILERAGARARSSDARVFGIARTETLLNRVVRNLVLTVAGRSLSLQSIIVYSPSTSSLINCDGILGSDIAYFGRIRIDATNGLFSVDD